MRYGATSGLLDVEPRNKPDRSGADRRTVTFAEVHSYNLTGGELSSARWSTLFVVSAELFSAVFSSVDFAGRGDGRPLRAGSFIRDINTRLSVRRENL